MYWCHLLGLTVLVTAVNHRNSILKCFTIHWAKTLTDTVCEWNEMTNILSIDKCWKIRFQIPQALDWKQQQKIYRIEITKDIHFIFRSCFHISLWWVWSCDKNVWYDVTLNCSLPIWNIFFSSLSFWFFLGTNIGYVISNCDLNKDVMTTSKRHDWFQRLSVEAWCENVHIKMQF